MIDISCPQKSRCILINDDYVKSVLAILRALADQECVTQSVLRHAATSAADLIVQLNEATKIRDEQIQSLVCAYSEEGCPGHPSGVFHENRL